MITIYTNTDLEPWTDGTLYKNYVYDNETKELRPISMTEKLIVEYCFPPEHHINSSCAELGYNKFEMEYFNTKDLFEAGLAVYEHLSDSRRYKSKIAKLLLNELPIYLKINLQNEK